MTRILHFTILYNFHTSSENVDGYIYQGIQSESTVTFYFRIYLFIFSKFTDDVVYNYYIMCSAIILSYPCMGSATGRLKRFGRRLCVFRYTQLITAFGCCCDGPDATRFPSGSPIVFHTTSAFGRSCHTRHRRAPLVAAVKVRT